MKIYDVLVPEEYDRGGEKKTKWHTIGVMFEQDGKHSIKLVMFPDLKIFAMERRGKNEPDF